jgi:hypothetical protein
MLRMRFYLIRSQLNSGVIGIQATMPGPNNATQQIRDLHP